MPPSLSVVHALSLKQRTNLSILQHHDESHQQWHHGASVPAVHNARNRISIRLGSIQHSNKNIVGIDSSPAPKHCRSSANHAKATHSSTITTPNATNNQQASQPQFRSRTRIPALRVAPTLAHSIACATPIVASTIRITTIL